MHQAGNPGDTNRVSAGSVLWFAMRNVQIYVVVVD